MVKLIITFITLFTTFSINYSHNNKKIIIGYVEKIYINDLGLSYNALIDTGATFSSLHAYGFKEKRINNALYINFYTSNEKGLRTSKTLRVERIIEVGSSMGQMQKRYSVIMGVKLGGKEYKTLFTLVNRKNVKYYALIGRELLKGRFIVDSDKQFVFNK